MFQMKARNWFEMRIFFAKGEGGGANSQTITMMAFCNRFRFLISTHSIILKYATHSEWNLIIYGKAPVEDWGQGGK